MSKLTVIIGVLLVVVASVGGYYFVEKGKEKELKVIEKSLSTAETVIGFYKGKNSVEDLKQTYEGYITEAVYLKLEGYLTDLQKLNDVTFNITEYYDETRDEDRDLIREEMEKEGIDELILSVDDLEDYDKTVENNYEDIVIEDDKRVIKGEEYDYINVRDLDFTKTGSDVVTYRGVNLWVLQENVPETYDRMIKNPDHIYKYVKYQESKEVNKKYIDVLFESINNGQNSIIVRVFNEKGKITDFEVR